MVTVATEKLMTLAAAKKLLSFKESYLRSAGSQLTRKCGVEGKGEWKLRVGVEHRPIGPSSWYIDDASAVERTPSSARVLLCLHRVNTQCRSFVFRHDCWFVFSYRVNMGQGNYSGDGGSESTSTTTIENTLDVSFVDIEYSVRNGVFNRGKFYFTVSLNNNHKINILLVNYISCN